jgi:hypothetical protein
VGKIGDHVFYKPRKGAAPRGAAALPMPPLPRALAAAAPPN